jgi:hypothetical protein
MLGVARMKAAMLVLSGIALAAPFVLVAKAQSAFADAVVSQAVAALVRATDTLAPVAAAAPQVAVADTVVTFDATAESAAFSAGKAPAPRSRAAAPAKPQALFVSAASVLQLSKSAARPQGTFVAQTPQHPAGLRLMGVAGLGIGVKDGDILVDAMGMTPRSSGEIIGAIIQARAQRVRYLSGTLWRSGQTFRITVEQPYLDPA